MAYLRYIDAAGQLCTSVLGHGKFVVGRADTCQLSFDSDMISREHLSIELDADGRYRIRDLGSRNKTHVNGELIDETLLTPGSVIRAGDLILEFADDSASGESLDLEFLTPDHAEPPDCEWIKAKTSVSLTFQQIEQLAQLLGDQPLTARSEDVASAALSRILLDLQAERGLVALRGDGKTDLHPIAQRGLLRAPKASMTPVSQSFVSVAMLQRVAGRYPKTASKLDTKLGYAATGVVAPLLCKGDVVGVVYVDRPQASRQFPSGALPYLAAAGAMLGALLAGVQRKLVASAGREGAAWLGTLRRLQESMSDAPANSDAFGTSLKVLPGRMQCGDFGSVVQIDEQRCGVFVVDGGGHGVTGVAQSNAMLLAVTTGLAVSDDSLSDPATMFNAISQRLAESGSRQVLPCMFAGIDMASGRLSYVNAGGMAPLLMVAPGRLVTLDKVALIPGVDSDYAYEGTQVDLPEMFRLVCYTDGVVEATSAGGEAFGDQRLHDLLLEREAFASPAEIVTRIEQAWTTHMAGAQAADDALILVLARG